MALTTKTTDYDDKKKPNICAIRGFRLKERNEAGEVTSRNVIPGEVVRKLDFEKKSDWQNIVFGSGAKAEETADPVGRPVKVGLVAVSSGVSDEEHKEALDALADAEAKAAADADEIEKLKAELAAKTTKAAAGGMPKPKA